MNANEKISGSLNGFSNENYEKLVKTCYPFLQKILKNRIPPHDLDDVCQDIMVKVVKKLHQAQEGKFQNWLRALAFNMAADFWRKKYRHKMEMLPVYTDDITSLQDNRTPEDIAIECEGLLDLYKAIWSLPLHKQEVVIRHYLLGFSTPEIAQELGAAKSTIRRWLMESRNELRAILE